MKIDFDFNDREKSGIKKKFLFQVIQKTLSNEEFGYLKNKNISISFASVDGKEIARINKIYRKKNVETDVLSFSEYKNQKGIIGAGDKNIYLGEIIVCYNYIKKYTKKEKKNMKRQLAEIISHGLLHLLGFKHSKKMFAIQKEVSFSF
ncbi:MAG TPA: rRNA maturation RNase YbeY [Candidatus Moranbacteria bacterium]|nr:rRNA maturation RNase YbeY [Candidatus Moranbacteria bacterium]